MSDLAGGEPRLRSPSPGRGGRFDDAGRRSPPPSSEKWAGSGPPNSNHRGRSADFARKRRRDESPPSRDRYIPNYEREPYRERDRREYPPYPILEHDRPGPPGRYGLNPEMFDDPYRRGGSAYRDEVFNYSPDRGAIPSRGGPNHSRPHLPPPSELPYLVSFRYFADFMRSTSPHIAEDKDKLAEQWKRYRQDHQRKQLVTFFEENKNKAWFREKYQPNSDLDELRERLKKKGREGKIEGFISRLVKGELDIVNYDYTPVNKKPLITKPSGDNSDERSITGIKSENNSGVPSTLHPQTSQDDETKQSVHSSKPDGETATGSENGKLKQESEAEPKVEVNSTNLDPEAEDYEEADDEFMVEALASAQTGSTPSSALGNLIGESVRGKSGSDDIVILPPSPNQLFIKSISPDISRVELENHCKQVEGFDYLALSDPHTGKKLHRVGWVSFVPGTDMKAAENALSESKINNFTLHLMRSERAAFQKLRLCPGIMNMPDRIVKDLEQIRKMAIHFEDEDFGVGLSEDKRGSTAIEAKINQMKVEIFQSLDLPIKKPQLDGVITPPRQDNSDESGLKTDLSQEQTQSLDKKALDFYLFYLRAAFNCCYYCVCVCDFPEELLRRCPKHVRKPASRSAEENSSTATPQSHRRNGSSQNLTHSRSNENSWARTLDERVTLILGRSEVDPREFGGERIDDEIHRLCQPQLSDEGAGKFRCKSCSKLFKAMNFIEKHIMTKHGEVINQDTIERIKYLNNYVLDPSHTTPQPPPLPDYGHPRSHNGMAAGSGPHGMMPNMVPAGHPPDFHSGAYPPMMNGSLPGHGGMMMGGPYQGYMAPMYPQYPNHSYPPMPGPSPMYPNGSMMGGPHDNGPGSSHGYGAPYYMGNMGPGGSSYPPGYPPHHQVYSSLPAIPPPAHAGRGPNGNSRRLGDRISRNFADDHHSSALPMPPNELPYHKRSRMGDDHRLYSSRAPNGLSGLHPSADLPPILSDPRSKSVLAYNDLDTPAGDEVVLNY